MMEEVVKILNEYGYTCTAINKNEIRIDYWKQIDPYTKWKLGGLVREEIDWDIDAGPLYSYKIL